MNPTPKRIPIPSDLVLKICINDLYDSDDELITIDDLSYIKLTFLCGGVEKVFELDPSSSCTAGSSIISDAEEDPYILVCLCTEDFLPGDLMLRSEVSIPDTRFHDDIRKEIAEANLYIKLV